MAFEANLTAAGQRYLVRSAVEREIAFARAGRHSRIVGVLRKVLPAVSVLVLAAYFVSTSLSVTVGDLTASISGLEVKDGNLRMVNPTLKGVDKKSGNYFVNAEYADQDVKNPKIIKLHAIKAELSDGSGGWSRMTAARGVFNSETERLVMQDKITISTSSGVSGELKHASLDTKTQTIRSHRPVHFDWPNGRVRANALTMLSAKKELIFRGKVHVHIDKRAKDDAAEKGGAKDGKTSQQGGGAGETTGALAPVNGGQSAGAQ